MTVDPKPARQPALPDTPQGGRPSPPSFALLAKRLSHWTTNCILTAVVLVMGLGFGRQVLRWWASDLRSASPSGAPLDMAQGLGDAAAAHDIRFGAGTWRLRRQSVVGSREQAMAALRASCREATRSSSLPKADPEPGEQRLLRSLLGRDPCDQEPGTWRLDALDGHFPMVVGTRDSDAPATANPGQAVAPTGRRVVTWGLAAPISQGSWTLYTFRQADPSVGRFPDLPLAPNSRSILSLGVEGGGVLTAVRGPARPDSWKSFYDQWFAAEGWRADADWRQAGSTWSKRYREDSDESAASVDVQFDDDARGELAGLLMFTPASGRAGGK